MSKNRKWLRTSFFWLLTLLIAVLVLLLIFGSHTTARTVNVSALLSDLKTDISKRQRDTLTVTSGTLILTRGKAATQEVATINSSFDITRVLKDNNINYTNNNIVTLQYQAPSPLWSWLGVLGGLCLHC